METSIIYTISLVLLFLSNGFSRMFKNKRFVTCLLCGIILAFVLGLRDPVTVGVDGDRYYRAYQSLRGQNISAILTVWGRTDYSAIGFYFLDWICVNLGIPFQYFTMMCGFLCIYVVSKIIYYFSSMPLLSYMLYLGLGFYTFAFSGQKEILSTIFILLSYFAMYKKERIKPWIYFGIAVSFHYTSIIFLPILLIGKIKISKEKFKILIVAIVPIVLMILYYRLQIAYWITITFAEGYVGKYEIGRVVGGTAILAILFTILFIFMSDFIKGDNVALNSDGLVFFERSMMYICVAASIIQAFSSYAYAFTRLAFYYIQFFIVSIPYSFQTQKARNVIGRYRLFVISIITVGLFFLMIELYFGHIEGEALQDYKFMWSN